ncbi:MAG: FAD-dependent oxidoreductase [Deltaproteobacteria bacterium]
MVKTKNDVIKISGKANSVRIESRLLEDLIQKAVHDGYRKIEIEAFGQHGIGGRLWGAGNEPVHITIHGHVGQRVGSMGFPNTTIEIEGPASDDVGWLNAGAKIIIHGHATNGVANAMAQGQIFVAGDVGARAMTMTKRNPRFDNPELWILGAAGDFFAEFMAGGVAVVCGYDTVRETVLGYRPCVGMVGGKIYFRGKCDGFSQADAKLVAISDDDWHWLEAGLKTFLRAIRKETLLPQLIDRSQWQVLESKKPFEKTGVAKKSMAVFAKTVWNKELGVGGLIADLTDIDRSQIDVLPTGVLRRFAPQWDNDKYLAPCQDACPTGIPVQKRWELIRNGNMSKAVDLALNYTPFPATVCGYLCPNLCMSSCTRKDMKLPLLDLAGLGKASLEAVAPQSAPTSGVKVAIIGGGAAGISAAWQLQLLGHTVTIYEQREMLGGKITDSIPTSRIPDAVINKEISRVKERVTFSQVALDKEGFTKLKSEHDFVVIAVGAQKPRTMPIEGASLAINAIDFLRLSKKNKLKIGEKVVIIGAGNVGCDVASEAHRFGAKEITLIDIQEPASFGVERKHAEAVGAKFLWPKFTQKITSTGVALKDGEFINADTVVLSIGDLPELSFLPETMATKNGFIVTDETFCTSDKQVFAIGDTVKLGLLTEAIGAGRIAVQAIDDICKGKNESYDTLPPIAKARIKTQYYNSCSSDDLQDIPNSARQCFSCGACRDCGMCETICPENAIKRKEYENGNFEYCSDDEKCIGCGFCADACPCGIWNLSENPIV